MSRGTNNTTIQVKSEKKATKKPHDSLTQTFVSLLAIDLPGFFYRYFTPDFLPQRVLPSKLNLFSKVAFVRNSLDVRLCYPPPPSFSRRIVRM